MIYHTTDTEGVSEINPPPSRMRAILAAVRRPGGADHPDVWLTNDDTGWSLTYTEGSVMILENLDNDEAQPRFMRQVSHPKALDLWQLLASGDTRALLAMDWERSAE